METQNNKIVIYQTPDGNTSIDVKLDGDTVWLTQHEMSLLFDVAENNITYHIKNIYKTSELDAHRTTQKIRAVRLEGSRQVRRTIDYYNLDMIISIGYRVNSINATQFRIWATKILKDYLIKGYAVNNRLRAENYTQLRQLVQILGRTVSSQEALTTDEARAIVDVGFRLYLRARHARPLRLSATRY